MKILIFIPARGGSKGIKKKNIIKLNNKPLIYYTIKLAKKLNNSNFFVSSDDKKIFKVAKKYGFKYNYLRPTKLSKSKSNVFGAVNHALKWLSKNYNLTYDAVLLLQPTSPLRNINEIKKAIAIFKLKKINSLASVTRMREHPEECVEIKGENWNFLSRKKRNYLGRQSFSKKFFFIDGSFYLIKKDILLKHKSFIIKKITKFYKLKTKWPIDIDDLEDLKVTESILKSKKNE